MVLSPQAFLDSKLTPDVEKAGVALNMVVASC